MAKTMNEGHAEIETVSVSMGRITMVLKGRSPLLYHAMSQKAGRDLLLPRGRLSTADKAVSLKHDPIEEYRGSVYRRSDSVEGPTRLVFPAASFKRAMGGAALRMPAAAKKTEINQLLWVMGEKIAIYGVPRLHMSVVRMADINRTPDIRTRAILPQWCAVVTVEFVTPVITTQAVANLIGWAGIVMGIGDWRPEKGGTHGQFTPSDLEDLEVAALMRDGTTAAQDAALANPVAHDAETEEIMSWYSAEVVRRGRQVQNDAELKAAGSANGETKPSTRRGRKPVADETVPAA